MQQRKLDLMRTLDRARARADRAATTSSKSAIANYELAFRMQTAVPELMDLAGETAGDADSSTASTTRPPRSSAAQCLIARRLVERGVRFVELLCQNVGDDRWDQHGNLKDGPRGQRPGRRPADRRPAQGPEERAACSTRRWSSGAASSAARRWPRAATAATTTRSASRIWLAGGGVKGGTIYGATDDYGYHAVENKVEIHDLHATMLHLLGIDHKRLTYRFGGRDMRLTDVHGEVIKEILA